MNVSDSTIVAPPSNSKVVRTLSWIEFFSLNASCKICGIAQWSTFTGSQRATRPSVLFPCVWINKDGEKAYAHLGEIIIAHVFKYTIEGQQVFFHASEPAHRVPGVNDDEICNQKELISSIIKNIRQSRLGCTLHVQEKLKTLRARMKRKNFVILQSYKNQDIHEAFAWMKNTSPSIQDMDDEKSPVEAASSNETPINIYAPIDPPSPDRSDKDSVDSDNDSLVDW